MVHSSGETRDIYPGFKSFAVEQTKAEVEAILPTELLTAVTELTAMVAWLLGHIGEGRSRQQVAMAMLGGLMKLKRDLEQQDPHAG